MPTYEYECNKCQHQFEKFESIKSEPVSECPVCGEKARRLISGGAGLIFKGSGFYITDYRSDSYKNDAKKDKQDSTTTSAKAKTESKSGGNGNGQKKESKTETKKTETAKS